MKLYDMYQNFQITHPYQVISIEHQKIRYRLFGHGEKTMLMLLGGSMFKYDAYFKLIESLEDTYQIITIDMPSDTKDITSYIQIIKKVLDLLNISKVHVFGTSQGGGIAQVFAKTQKAYTESMILYNTLTRSKHMNPHSTDVIKQVLEAISELEELRKIMSLDDIKRALIDQLSSVLMDPNDLDLFEKLIMEYSEHDEKRQMRLIQDLLTNYVFEKEDFEYLKQKVLVFYGHDDDPFGGTELIETLVELLTEPNLEFIDNDRLGLILDPTLMVDKIKSYI